jgi:hypothetical protein
MDQKHAWQEVIDKTKAEIAYAYLGSAQYLSAEGAEIP